MRQRPSIRGARAANAGDDYHELWALREALTLLDPQSSLTAMTVEGLHPDDEASSPLGTWDGVDCGYYFGGEDLGSADRVVLDQVKYSTSEPALAWTIARLIRPSRRTRASSVIGRLGTAFGACARKRPDLVSAGKVRVRLVSNQPVAREVLRAVEAPARAKTQAAKHYRALLSASGLRGGLGAAFIRALDFSECGAGSRLALEAGLVQTLEAWTHPDARGIADTLRRRVRELMMPERKDELLTRADVLLWFSFSAESALFPCPSAFTVPRVQLTRAPMEDVLALFRAGEQRVCVHGGAGVGKTTAVLSLSKLLPPNSATFAFDCYGQGRYLDAESPRHRPPEAYLQLANEMAAHLRLPPLLNRAPNISDFATRLRQAAEALASSNRDAWLVLIIDAADNSVYAAERAAPAEHSFVGELARLGQLPANVRMVVTTRTSRLPSLNLEPRFRLVKIDAFSPTETATLARLRWADAPDEWLEDFHVLSHGNPRVQAYAFAAAADEPARALDALLPEGKLLSDVFSGQLHGAMLRAGVQLADITRVAQGLIAFPRPVPLRHLSAVVQRSEVHLCELAEDLSPGLRIGDEGLSFADEDFEDFIRSLAGDVSPIWGSVADRLTATEAGDVYSAVHIAPVLLAAGRRKELLGLVRRGGPPAIVSDPVLRREVQLQRMRIAVRVCREAGDVADALLTSVRGAGALKTNAAIRDALTRFPDVAVRFAERAVAQMFLQAPDAVETHGRFLFHRLDSDAAAGDYLGARHTNRWLGAWLRRRDAVLRAAEQARKQPDAWEVGDEEIAAEFIASLRVIGPVDAWKNLCRWSPDEVRYRALLLAASRLIAAGEGALLRRAADAIDTPETDLILRVPMGLQEGRIDEARIHAALLAVETHPLIEETRGYVGWPQPAAVVAYQECLITACELCIAAGARSGTLSAILTRYGAPGQSEGVTADPPTLDLRLRALAMLARLGGGRVRLSDFMAEKPAITQESTTEAREEAERWESQYRDWDNLVGPLFALYDARAACLLGEVPGPERETLIRGAVEHIESEAYRMRHHRSGGLRARAASALLTLLGLPDAEPRILWGYADRLATTDHLGFGQRDVDLYTAAGARPELHDVLLKRAASIANDVKQAQMASREQIDALCAIARALLPISDADARAIFDDALVAAEGVDEDAMDLIRLLSKVASAGAPTVGADVRRTLACDTAIVLEDAAIRLSGYDHFPWSQGATALATWDLPFAFAAAARWDDSGLVRREVVVAPIVRQGLSSGSLSASVAVSLLPLVGWSDHYVLEAIVGEGASVPSALRGKMAEQIAADELLMGEEGMGRAVDRILSSVTSMRVEAQPGPWEKALAARVALHSPHPGELSEGAEQLPPFASTIQGASAAETVRAFSWAAVDLGDPEALAAAIHALTDREGDEAVYITASLVHAHIRALLAPRERIAYLEALLALMRRTGNDAGNAADALDESLEAWQGQPAVGAWTEQRFLDQLPEVLLAFRPSYIAVGLERICRRTASARQAASDGVRDALLRGLEQHVDALSASEIYWLAGLIGEFTEPSALGRVAVELTRHMLDGVKLEHRPAWAFDDLAVDLAPALGRFVFALLGDMDTRVRWLAAHTIRRFASLEQTALIDEVVAHYNRRDEPLFRSPDAPFYWQAARLWLVIALGRIAEENPDAIRRHGRFLVGAGTEAAFPHLLLRDCAARAARALRAAGCGEVRDEDLTRLDELIGARTPRSSGRYWRPMSSRKRPAEARFEFDTVDTLPYWYEPAAQVFTDVSLATFVERADHWIVDEWGIAPSISRWADEPRKHRLSDRHFGEWAHSHGSEPVIERFSTFLEWHAMWCAASDLLKNHTLRRPDGPGDDYHTLEGWLRRAGLNNAPYWLSDLRSPRPIRAPLFDTKFSEAWVDAVGEADFVAEAGLNAGESTLILRGSWGRDRKPGHASATVRAAFVTPSRAVALLRALQTVDSAHDFRLPDAGDELEIRVGGHRLLGVVGYRENEGGIDDHDPFHRGAPGLAINFPGPVRRATGLRFVVAPFAAWEEASTGRRLARYESWSESDPHSRYASEGTSGTGWRLVVDREFLLRLMVRRKLDLLLSVGISRRFDPSPSYGSHSQDKASEAYHSRIYLLRRGGELRTTDGPLGAWAPSGP